MSIGITMILFSCREKTMLFLSPDNLASQYFEIDINKDTVLRTTGGIIIQIPAGSLMSKSPVVKLEIKEALTINDIVLGGLHTSSGIDPLSSGGMFYLNAADGYEMQVVKPLAVRIPTKNYITGAKLFSGKETAPGKIDWQNPQSLKTDSSLQKIIKGESLFKANCSSCHKIMQVFAAPPLYGVTYRRPKKWLYDYTRNPSKMMESGDIYANCIFQQWKPTMMTSFSGLDDRALDSLYAYIKAETDKQPFDISGGKMSCCDSCEAYLNAARPPQTAPVIRDSTILLQQQNNSNSNQPDDANEPYSNDGYYSFTIDKSGWHNIDIFLEELPALTESRLFVKVSGYKKALVDLIIPSYKVFTEGYPLGKDDLFYFKSKDGILKLPQGTECIVIAHFRNGDQELFGNTFFKAGGDQLINIGLKESDNKKIKAFLKSFRIKTENIPAEQGQTVINRPGGTKTDTAKLEKAASSLKPKNCDCGSTVPRPGAVYNDNTRFQQMLVSRKDTASSDVDDFFKE